MNLDVIAKISSAKINLLYSSIATPIRHKFVDVTPISAQLHGTTLRRHVVRKDMALLKYFKRVDHNPGLPDPNGSLSLTMRPSAIQSANEEVEKEVKGEGKKRGCYQFYTSEERATVAKKALEIGVTRAIKHFQKNPSFNNRTLKESTVRTWVNLYTKELKVHVKSREVSGTVNIVELPAKRRGRPLLLGDELDSQLKSYVTKLRDLKAVVNSDIVKSAAIGIVKSQDSNLLHDNGGHLEITRQWAKHFLHRIGYSKRRVTTKASVSDFDFANLKAQFLFDIAVIVNMEEIPESLIINWDHTGINYVPVSNWTMAPEGSKRVEVAGHNDKRQITSVFAATMSGEILPPQIIFSGKTKRCLPTEPFPDKWNITFTQNHWANESTTELYIKSILLPYLQKKRKDLSLSPNQPALVLFDRFKGQCTTSILTLLKENNIYFVVVPGRCTDRLQPLDVSVNKAIKENLRNNFQQWYSDQVCRKINEGIQEPVIDLSMAVVKPLSVRWLISAFNYISANPDIITNGFKGAGIVLDSK